MAPCELGPRVIRINTISPGYIHTQWIVFLGWSHLEVLILVVVLWIDKGCVGSEASTDETMVRTESSRKDSQCASTFYTDSKQVPLYLAPCMMVGDETWSHCGWQSSRLVNWPVTS
jgi:hypothetical protein